jgi:hypothetical protein
VTEVESAQTPASGPTASRPRKRKDWLLNSAAGVLVWFALLAPSDTSQLTPVAFLRIPLEGLLVAALLLVLRPRARRPVAVVAGALLGLLAIVKFLDLGFRQALDRSFNPVSDWRYLGPAVSLLSDSIGRPAAVLAVATAGLLGVALLICTPLSALRLARLVDRHRVPSIRAVTAFGVGWLLCAGLGAQLSPTLPLASLSTARLAYGELRLVAEVARDQQSIAAAAADDPFRETPNGDLLTGLRGKDVIVAFVESYGRVAVEGSAFSAQIDATLDAGTRRLRAAGFSSRSAFLTSPTFGGISWLAHSTFQSGLWIDSQQRYDELLRSNRLTLSEAFSRAGWRTVADIPSNYQDWPQGMSFYHYDKLYDSRNVGYYGPRFSYASMPDQYTLSAFQRMELARPDRPPVMAEIDLVSSHTPWAPLPRLVDWDQVGIGSVFDGMPAQGLSPDFVWRDPDRVRAAYGHSIEYTLNTLVSFVATYPDKDLVLIVVGDHQPATIVSGEGASHDVPISIIAHDKAVMDKISGWGWQDGMRPGRLAPVWPMDAFRDRFLSAYGHQPCHCR